MNAEQIRNQVQAIIKECGINTYVDVIAICSGNRSWRRVETGAFQISIPAFAVRGTRRHLFRTDRKGVVPVEKIKVLAKAVAEQNRQRDEYQARLDANNELAKEVREYAKEQLNKYFAEWTSSCAFITPSSEKDTVRANFGTLTLTAEQAKQMVDLLATFKNG